MQAWDNWGKSNIFALYVSYKICRILLSDDIIQRSRKQKGLTLIKCFPFYYVYYFPILTLFNLYNDSMKELLLSSFYTWDHILRLLNYWIGIQTLAYWMPESMPFILTPAAFPQVKSSEGFFSELVKTILVSSSLVIFIANKAAIYPALVRTLLITSTHSISKHGIYWLQKETRLWENINGDNINKCFQSKPLFGS